MWLFKVKNKFGKGKAPRPTTRPGMPPPGYMRPPMMKSRQIIPRGAPRRTPTRRPIPKQSKDTVFDDTMKKLKKTSTAIYISPLANGSKIPRP